MKILTTRKTSYSLSLGFVKEKMHLNVRKEGKELKMVFQNANSLLRVQVKCAHFTNQRNHYQYGMGSNEESRNCH